MTREEAIDVLKNRYYSGVTRSKTDDEWRLATDTAIAALREKVERERGCEYCTKLTNLSYSDASYYDDIRACVGMQKDIHILERHKKDDYVLNISSHAGNWIDYPIHYCPMCGRKLEVEG